MSRAVDIDTARSLISIGVDAALNAIRDVTTDRRAIVDRQVLELCARAERDRREKRRQAHERTKAKDPDALRTRNREAKRRQRERERKP